MIVNDLFQSFDNTIRLAESKKQKLRGNRDNLREVIRKDFKKHEWRVPKFYSQGSFPLNTNLNPIKKKTDKGDIKEEYDLDDGVYFICKEGERKEPKTYHDRIKKAVEGEAEEVIDKNTCVRVVYADGHHIDLPCYWLEQEGDVPRLAHLAKGYIESDPKEFKTWVDEKIQESKSNDQLRRIIRYFKAWKNYRETENRHIKLPSGFIFTILACQEFKKDPNDDVSFSETANRIFIRLVEKFECYRPTTPKDEELLQKYDRELVLKELRDLVCTAQEALISKSKKEASEFWRKIFGDRFPLDIDSEKEKTIITQISRPYYHE